MKNNQDFFNVLRQVQNKPKSSQRQLANELGFSLGKINYCLKALKKKGLIKIENFGKNKNKINYVYLLTPKGILEKMNLTVNFMKTKMKEYEELQKEHLNDQRIEK
jgi:EPS-associated MarR family transcriptional regulator